MNRDTVTAGGWALWALALTTWLAFTAWLITSARRELRARVPMSREVLAHTIRETLHAELAAAGIPAAQQDDPLEELWEASP